MDPFSALASFVLGKMKDSCIEKWWKLIFSVSFSAVVAFLFFAGTVTLKTNSFTTGIATGMIAAAFAMLALFMQSPLTKGLTIYIPKQIIEEEKSQDIQAVEHK